MDIRYINGKFWIELTWDQVWEIHNTCEGALLDAAVANGDFPEASYDPDIGRDDRYEGAF